MIVYFIQIFIITWSVFLIFVWPLDEIIDMLVLKHFVANDTQRLPSWNLKICKMLGWRWPVAK